MNESIYGGTPAMAGRLARSFAAGLVALLAGCATQTGTVAVAAKSREAIVQERAQARWDALLKKDMARAYELYSPASRAVLGYEDFIRSIRVGFWKAAQVDKVVCQAEDACEAYVTIEYQHRGSQVRTPIRETWIRMEGNWWYVQKG